MNISFNHIIEQIIPSFLEGNCSDDELNQLNGWLAEDEKNAIILEEITQIWNRSKNEKSSISVEQSWKNFEKKASNKKGFKFSMRSFSIAASILLVVGFSFFYVQNNKYEKKIIYASNLKDSLIFEDGSKVFSSGNAVVEYHSSFAKNTREVSQKSGTAFYEITKNPERPFIIHNHLADIKVLGTSFKTNMNNDSVEVVVTTGKVKVYHDMDSVIILPTERVVFYKNNTQAVKSINHDLNYLYWKTNILQYQDERLENVFKDIEEKFGCKIIVNNEQVNNLRLTGKFPSKVLTKTLLLIAETLQLRLQYNSTWYKFSFDSDKEEC
jgi:transmembrane sensor